MANEDKIKILVLGPVSTGKTSICNRLGDTEGSFGDNRPTRGVRIVEFTADTSGCKTEVELWDCSGDGRYERCWPALRHCIRGIIFVYTENSSSQRQVLENMHNFFVEDCGFPEKKCILLWNNGDKRKPEKCPLEGMQQTVVDLADNDHELKKTFNTFLKTIQSDRLSKNKNEK